MVETYIHDMKPDVELGEVPSGDTYFLGRLDLSHGLTTTSFVPDRSGWFHRLFGPLTAMKYNDAVENQLDSTHYDFTFVRREFLGDVRCLVIDVVPRKNTGPRAIPGTAVGGRPGLQHRPLQRHLRAAASPRLLLPFR